MGRESQFGSGPVRRNVQLHQKPLRQPERCRRPRARLQLVRVRRVGDLHPPDRDRRRRARPPELFLDALGWLLAPGLRPYLIVANDQWPTGPRQLAVRYDSVSKPLSDPTNWPVQVSWRAPAGVWEAAALVSATLQSLIAST